MDKSDLEFIDACNRFRATDQDRIAELEAKLSAQRYAANTFAEKINTLEAENKRLKDALIPVPEQMSLSQIEAWLNRYEIKRTKALEGE